MTILSNADLSAACGAADHRRISPHAGGIHTVVGRKVYAAKRDRIKHIAAGRAITERQFATQRNDRNAVTRCSDAASAADGHSHFLIAPRTVIPQPPRPQIDAAGQIEKLAAAVTVFSPAFAAAEPPARQGGINALIPSFRRLSSHPAVCAWLPGEC